MTQPSRPRTQVTDVTGRTVAANVRRLRDRRGLSTYEMSRVLQQAGRPITPSAIAKIERAERRVDVGDLMALAAALGVSPSALLLPLDDSPNGTVPITGAGEVNARIAWDWADGQRPLFLPEKDWQTIMLEYKLFGRPPYRRMMHHSFEPGPQAFSGAIYGQEGPDRDAFNRAPAASDPDAEDEG